MRNRRFRLSPKRLSHRPSTQFSLHETSPCEHSPLSSTLSQAGYFLRNRPLSNARPERPLKLRQRGAALVEFSLVILPTFALIFMAMDLAWILFGWASIQEGVREGVRFGVTGQTINKACLGDSVKQVVTRYAFGFANTPAIIDVKYLDPTTLLPITDNTGPIGGNVLKVTVSGVSIGTFGPIFRQFSPISLAATSSDVIEPSPNPPCP